MFFGGFESGKGAGRAGKGTSRESERWIEQPESAFIPRLVASAVTHCIITSSVGPSDIMARRFVHESKSKSQRQQPVREISAVWVPQHSSFMPFPKALVPTTWDGCNSVIFTQENRSPEIIAANEAVRMRGMEDRERIKSRLFLI